MGEDRMEWARVRTADGRVLTGVIEGAALHTRAALGAEETAGAPVPLAGVEFLAPCAPGKMICLWNNFHAAAEKNGWTPPEHPLWFLKPDSALADPGATVALPEGVRRVVFEGELGIVIGRECRRAGLEEAEAAILGYTCVNDLTALDPLNANPAFPQWTRAKGHDGFGPFGPVIATGLDWRALAVTVLVNGRERQNYPCSDMILDPPTIVSLLSRDVTLNPGDVIACGTSLGARPVKAGDVVEVVIEGIGTLGVTMAAEG
jgi:2-keto-4-pentenoate hydratase/2-oxohepta-3-ene-1,7-dioic acid hydratase in catechol pathway